MNRQQEGNQEDREQRAGDPEKIGAVQRLNGIFFDPAGLSPGNPASQGSIHCFDLKVVR
jgi:hypothetical protein